MSGYTVSAARADAGAYWVAVAEAAGGAADVYEWLDMQALMDAGEAYALAHDGARQTRDEWKGYV